MASLITHPLVPIALAVAAGRGLVPLRLMLAGMALAMLPDADVVAFAFGIPYGSPWGHRGFAHSAVAAACCALLLVPASQHSARSR